MTTNLFDGDPLAVATPPPAVAPTAPTPTVDSSDVVSRYLNNITATAPAPTVAPTTTPEQIAAADAAGIYTTAGMDALLAGGSAADIAAAEQAAGAPQDVVDALLQTGIPGVNDVQIASTNLAVVGSDIGIDAMPDTQDYGHDDQGSFDVLGYFPEMDGYELLSVSTLKGQAFIDYVRAGCAKRDLDALAVLANAYSEGLGGGIGDNGTSYGPWQLHDGGALPRKYWNLGKNVARIQTWAWSTAGIDYALDCMASTEAKGKTGRDAVYWLVYKFEKPTDKAGQYLIRLRTYSQLASMGGGAWAWLAKYAAGPKYATSTAPATAPSKPQPTRVIGSWRDLVATLRDDVPAAGIHMQNTARRLKGAVT